MTHRTFLFFVLAGLYSAIPDLQAQVKVSVRLPEPLNPHEKVFMAGSFNGWSPSDSLYELNCQGDSCFGVIAPGIGRFEYKITKGSWQKCEGTVTGSSRPNRTFSFPEEPELKIQVEGWESQSNNKKSTATKEVMRIDRGVKPDYSESPRTLHIYLPPGYASDSLLRYPVIYLQDGQNVFDNQTAFAGEWGVDELLNEAIAKGFPPCIVVAVDNSGSERINEYSPWINPTYGGGNGDKYARFMAYQVKPYIDSTFLTRSDPENTLIGGSSMGALIAVYCGLSKPQVFGKVLAFSPSFWFSDSVYLGMNTSFKPSKKLKIYLMCGISESAEMVKDMEKFAGLLRRNGVPAKNVKTVIHADGQHKEWFWSREFIPALSWLLNH